MSNFVKLCGGRKAFGFYLFVALSATLFVFQAFIEASITFDQLVGFWQFVFLIYCGGNVAEKFRGQLNDR